MTQHEMIIDYVKEFGSITPMDAFMDLGITKLSTRIGELEKYGVAYFNHNRETRQNRFYKKVSYCRYTFKEAEDGGTTSKQAAEFHGNEQHAFA